MNIQKLEFCPACSGKELIPFTEIKDYSITGEIFKIEECKNCGLKFTNSRPDEESIYKYYQSEDYISHSDIKEGFINKIYHWVRSITVKKKLSMINDLGNGNKSSILDIGCGTGYFLKACKENGWNVEGIEPDSKAGALAKHQTNSEVHQNIFEIKESKIFGIITMWHVLEHVHQLNGTLTKINSLLKDKGILVIAVPNPESFDAKIYKEYWAAYDVPRHLYHFNKKSIEYLLSIHQFKLKEIKGMPFDSFYVSLMSEKYKTEKKSSNYFKAFINGLRSNISALKSNKNYSSLIYIAEKIGNEK